MPPSKRRLHNRAGTFKAQASFFGRALSKKLHLTTSSVSPLPDVQSSSTSHTHTEEERPMRALRLLYTSPTRRLPRTPNPARTRTQTRWSSSRPIASQLVFPDDGAEPSAVRHIHLTSDAAFPSYAAASDFQTSLRQAFLDWKSAPTPRAPSPLVVSFTPKPTYTLGKRQKSLREEQLVRLKHPLSVTLDNGGTEEFTPEVVETDRGGLTTYHGPGQLVLWPIIDLRSAYYPPQTVRSYARLLEETTRAVLASPEGPAVVPTYLSEEDPGVWSSAARSRGQERKMAAVGVHLRRHVSGLGTALNLDVVVDGDERVNPWARFVPCGLDGKTATSMRAEVGPTAWEEWRSRRRKCDESAEPKEWYARRWVVEFTRRLGVTAADGTVYHRL